jgi:hypothetical protein
VEDPYHWDDRVDAWEEVAATPTFRALQQRILDVAEPAPDDVAVLGLALGPLRFTPRPWNAATFNEPLTGRITQLSGVSRGIVSLVGQGTGEQNVLVRADLLIAPRRLLRTAFQMEYLPSGELCTGKVTTVQWARLRS